VWSVTTKNYTIYLTISTSNTSEERFLSAIKGVQSYIKNYTEQGRLQSLAFLHNESAKTKTRDFDVKIYICQIKVQEESCLKYSNNL
jgi:hypothetical protein